MSDTSEMPDVVYLSLTGDWWPAGDMTDEEMRDEEFCRYVRADRVESWLRGDILNHSPTTPIGLPSDGESYTLETLDEFEVKLLELRAMGYCIPDWVFDDIEDERSGN